MEILLKAAAIGIAASAVGLVIRKHNSDMALMLTLAAAAAMLVGAAALISPVLSFINELAENAGISSELLSPVLKAVAISIIGKVASDVCRDAGQSALSGAIEFCAVLAVLICAIPLTRAILVVLKEVMQ
jgi:stage III sporulation protein AD